MMKWIIPIILPAIAHCQSANTTWDWQLSPPYDLDMPVDVLDLDPDEISSADIARLKARSVYLICYVSVGTIEDWRRDIDMFPASVIGARYGDWPDERFLDIRQHDVLLPLMEKRFQRCADMGFDAIEPDNMDVYSNDSGFALTADDAVAYVLELRQIAKALGLDIGQKNVPELTGALAEHMDFAITENCLTDGWCDKVQAYAARGRSIFAAEYNVAADDRAQMCARGRRLGLSLIFKDVELTRERTGCLR